MPNLFSYFSSPGSRKCLLAVSFTLLYLLSKGQEQNITLSFLEDSVAVHYGETFSNKLLVTNNSPNNIILISEARDSLALISLPDTLFLNAGEQRSLLVKYLANPLLFRVMSNKIIARYHVSGKTNSLQAAFFAYAQNGEQLLLAATSAVNYLSMSGNEGMIPLRCTNNGYVPLTFTLQLKSYPEGLIITDNNQSVTLQPGSQQLVLFRVHSMLTQNFSSDFNISVQAVDPLTAKQLTITFTKVMALSSEKRMGIPNNADAALINNMAQLSYWTTSSGFNYYQLNAKGLIRPSENNALRYNLNLNYYTNPFSGAEMYDSWIAYNNKHFGVQAGNIYDNLDYPLFGKGVKASVFLDSGNTVSGYYVKNNYLLFSNVNQQREGATIWAGSYMHSSQSNNTSLVYLNGNDPFTGVQTKMVSTKSGWQFPNNQFLELSAGYSHEALANNPTASQNGYAGGIRYRGHWAKWDLLSDNYYSTPYYSGLRRGSLLLQEHIDYQLNKQQRLFVHTEVVNNTPGYLSNYYSAFVNTKSAQYQTGLTTALHHWFINVHPYFYAQSLHQNIANTELALRSTSWHVAADISYSRNGQSLMLMGDYGAVQSNNPYQPDKNYAAWQWRFNYSTPLLGINALLQHNPIYLMQEASPWQQGNFRQYSLEPYIHFYLFNKTLKIEASDNLNYYSYFQGWANTVQGKLSVRFRKTWQAAVQTLYNTYQQHQYYNFSQTQVSVAKSFIEKNLPGYKNISITFFGDKNANGIWDADEAPVENVIAEMNQSFAQSNRKGKISFTNLKPAAYKLHIQNGNGWWPLDVPELFVSRNKAFTIALVKTATVAGRIIPQKNTYIQDASPLEGITVIATGQQGDRHTILADAAGNFSFNLPVKTFTFSVETMDAGQLISDQPQTINVKEKDNPLIIFNLTDHTRRVNIQQF